MTSTASTETLALDRSRHSSWVDREAYPFRSRWLALPEGRLHYIDEGSGRGTDDPVVLVHGTPTWSFEYRHLIAGLRRPPLIALDHLGFGLSERPADASYTPEAHAARFRAFVDGLGLSRFTLVVHDFGGPIALPVALDDPGRVSRAGRAQQLDVELRRGSRDGAARAHGVRRVRPFMYRRLNASLRLVTPSAYGDRRKLTRAIHRQYLAAFPDADSRERVLWALARALLGSSAFYDGLWQRRDQLAAIPALIVWGMKDSAFRPDPARALADGAAAGHGRRAAGGRPLAARRGAGARASPRCAALPPGDRVGVDGLCPSTPIAGAGPSQGPEWMPTAAAGRSRGGRSATRRSRCRAGRATRTSRPTGRCRRGSPVCGTSRARARRRDAGRRSSSVVGVPRADVQHRHHHARRPW